MYILLTVVCYMYIIPIKISKNNSLVATYILQVTTDIVLSSLF